MENVDYLTTIILSIGSFCLFIIFGLPTLRDLYDIFSYFKCVWILAKSYMLMSQLMLDCFCPLFILEILYMNIGYLNTSQVVD